MEGDVRRILRSAVQRHGDAACTPGREDEAASTSPGRRPTSGPSRTTRPTCARQQIYLNFGEGTPVDRKERRRANGMRAMYEGPVREAAVVYVNGKRAGAVWCAPYQVDVSGLLQDGENTIRVVVANTALNLMAKGPLPDYKALTAKYGERFQAQDMGACSRCLRGCWGR